MKKIKALIFDLDGTAIPNRPDGLASKRVISAVEKASKLIKVGCATGREIQICQHIIQSLSFNAPCIIAGGSQIIHQSNFNILWERTLYEDKLREIAIKCRNFPYIMMSDGDIGPNVLISEYSHFIAKPIVYIVNIPKEESKKVLEALSYIEDIATHAVIAWTPGNVDVHITHKEATKKYAIQEWLQRENINKDEIMVVGDSNNDLPLFESAGLKIAMGNGSDELKAKADWIAPTVNEDGLAIAIEKFILNPNS